MFYTSVGQSSVRAIIYGGLSKQQNETAMRPVTRCVLCNGFASSTLVGQKHEAGGNLGETGVASSSSENRRLESLGGKENSITVDVHL